MNSTIQNYNGVECLAPKMIMNHWVNNEAVYWHELTGYEYRFFDQSGNQLYIRPDNIGGLNVNDQKWGFGYDGLKSCLSLSATNLPTSASGLLSGRIWRDGTLLRIVSQSFIVS